MTEWLRANWKPLLLAVGAGVLVILLYLWQRGRAQGQAAGTVTFPQATGASTADLAGAAAAPAAAAAATTKGRIRSKSGSWWDVNKQPLGVPLYSHPAGGAGTQLLGYIPYDAVVDVLGTATGIIDAANPAEPAGKYQISWGGLTGYIGQPDISGFQTGVGAGGPDLARTAGNLQAAAVRAETRGHQLGPWSSRWGARWRHDAAQAAAESRRIFVESRGAAPVRR